MKLAIASDIHLEFGPIELSNDEGADVLILAGDIMLAEELYDKPSAPGPYEPPGSTAAFGEKIKRVQGYRDFLARCSREFADVIYIAGNHEFYGGRWVASLQHLRDECKNYSNIHFLEREAEQIMDVTFIGSTLWTDMNRCDPLTLHAVRDMMSDFHRIRDDSKGYGKLRPATTVERHRQSLDYIKAVIGNLREAESDQKVVVVGHHAPSSLSIAPEYAGKTLMNGAYHSDLTEFILDRPEIKLWVHGHMHDDFDYMIGDTRVVCNPRGYIGYETRARTWNLKYVEV